MNADGTGVRRVTSDLAFNRDPEWMPAGDSLVFTRQQEGPAAIYRVWIGDRRLERLSQTGDRAMMPAVSPDGSHVAYTVGTPDGFQIFVLSLESRHERQITRVADGAIRPSWSRDGRYIFYTHLRHGPSQNGRVSLDDGSIESVASMPAHWVQDARSAPAGEWMAVALSPIRTR